MSGAYPNNSQQHGGGPAELAGDGPRPHPLQSHPVNAYSPAQQYPPAELEAERTGIPSPLTPLSSTQATGRTQAQIPPSSSNPPPYTMGEDQQQHFPPPPPGPPPTNQQAQYFPPPPPGPPPSDQKHPQPQQQQQQQQYFPPPPPGPPPNQIHITEEEHPDVPPPSYADIDGTGASFSDSKPPLPLRPASAQGQAASTSQAQQALPTFAPPPKSPNLSKPSSEQFPQHYDPQHYNPQAPSGTTASATANPPSKKQGGGLGQKLYQWGLKAGAPINKMTNRLGSESFWPDTMDKECDKAARILKSFCKDGFYTTPSKKPPTSGPSSESKVLVQIPRSAIANAAGLAIFTTFRAGLHISGAGGSGIVMARLPDGSWSPPSGFLVHTIGAGINIGFDIYDCVCVLNTPAAVTAFTRPRLSLGGEIAVVAGPVGAGASVEAALGGGPRYNSGKAEDTNSNNNSKDKGKGKGKGCSIEPVWSYMKSRGFYAGVQADGTIIVQRPDANAAFYGERGLTVEKILSGNVKSHSAGGNSQEGDGKAGGIVMWPEGARQLIEVLKVAEGKGADANVINRLSTQPTPGDLAAPVSPEDGNNTMGGSGPGVRNAEPGKTGMAPRYG
ncbi:hypothetical protein F4809DRAFT_317037 [Biscogniauxia mediterranea]|nr:hypothetical protein F4809DRAFT_317037 [Biscogniauxia mediterranea]